ncbi:hypothetical protein HUU39_24760 [candidate division KSB1 bacterium]|nr:hypothetical protein [candidate division KSB1 bacterium]
MLSRLVETNRLDAHDSQIFTELLSCRHPGGPTYNNRQKPAIICHLSDYAADVDTAFEIVLEEIESAIENLNHDGAKAFESSDYDLVQTLRQAGHRMTEFRDKVYALQKEWNSSFISERTQFSKSERQSKRTQKLSQGLRTREDELRIPILRALTKLGGAAASVDVLREVRESMKSALNEYDLATLPSSGMLRWENAAHWARYEMVKDGLLASGSPRGVWELTPKGKSWLAYQNGNINL